MKSEEKKPSKVDSLKKEIIVQEHYGYKFTLDNDQITVLNQNSEKCFYKFVNDEKKFVGHTDMDVIPTKWVSTRPSIWADHPTNKRISVEIIEKEKFYKFDINFEKNTIIDITDNFIQVQNFVVKKVGISVLIACYGVDKYIMNTINSFLSADRDYVDLEILVGVDNDRKSLSKLSNGDLSEKVKVYFSNENVGPYIMTNSLATLAKHDILIIFGGDDIADDKILSVTAKELNQYDILRWGCVKMFENGQVDPKKEILEMPGCFALRKKVFLDTNGYKPWRVQADDEFKRRLDPRFTKIKLVEPMFKYLIRIDSLSRSQSSNGKSELRNAYINLIESYVTHGFSDPKRLHTTPLMRCV